MANVLITGANRGIGLELARQFKARGDRVIAVGRRSSPELEELGAELQLDVDVSNAAQVRGLADRLQGTKLDLLINNAGVLIPDSLDSLDDAGVRRQLEVNAIGPLLVSAALAPLMGKGSKLAIVTSRMGSLADNTSGAMYGYRMSKAAVNAAGVSLARDLAPRGIAVVILHPGYVRTEMTGGNGMIDATESAQGLVARIDELTLESSGRFMHMNGEQLPW